LIKQIAEAAQSADYDIVVNENVKLGKAVLDTLEEVQTKLGDGKAGPTVYVSVSNGSL
jgi:hypothetical protein